MIRDSKEERLLIILRVAYQIVSFASFVSTNVNNVVSFISFIITAIAHHVIAVIYADF